MEHNLNQAKEFLRLLTGDANTPVTWQIFYDPKGEEQKPELAKHFNATLDEALPLIQWSQEQYCGVYACVNETDGKGRENHNITAYRAVFADFDGMEEPQWSLAPHFVQKRDATHGHAFWLIDDVFGAEQFMRLQKRISIVYGTDHQVTDPARVIRVAGFNHYKDPQNPAQYTVTDDNTDGDHKYTTADIEAAFPLTATQDAELNGWLESRQGNLSGTGYENSEHYNNIFMNWCENTAPPAIAGSGSHTVIKVASYAHDRGIPLETASELMWNHYNHRCMPPWDITERDDFEATVKRSYQYATSAAGCKTARAGFKALRAENPLPEPVGGWAANAAINDKVPKVTTVEAAMANQDLITPLDTTSDAMKGRLTYDQAAVSFPMMNSKSSHYDLARSIDGLIYHGRHLIRCDKLFYAFNGKVWQVIADDVIKAAVMRFYADYKPSDTFTRGVFNVLCDLVNVLCIQNGTWLTHNDIDPSGLVIFKNGILDTNNVEGGLMPHTSNLFAFNSLSYDYTPKASCPEFLKFINQVFQGDAKLIKQLQQWIGYCMTHDARYQKMAVFLGKSRAGKGVLTGLIRKLVGEKNTVAPSLSNFTKDSALNAMSKASLILVPDAHTVAFSNRAGVLVNIKAITGCDPIDYHVMYKGTQTSMFSAKIMISSNNMPDFEDSSGALANRMLVFPFNISFAGREDIGLKARIESEAEGICQWALEGLASLRADGKFTEADSGLEEKEDIREDMFPLAAFVRSSCDLHVTAKSTVAELFAAYKMWCTFGGVNKPMTEIQMNKVLRNSELPITSARPVIDGLKVRGFKGIRVSTTITGSISDNGKVVRFEPVKPAETA